VLVPKNLPKSIKTQDHIISSLNFIQIIHDWFIVVNVTTLKLPTNTLKINTLMELRVDLGTVVVCANSHFWEEWTQVFWKKIKLKRLILSFFPALFSGLCKPRINFNPRKVYLQTRGLCWPGSTLPPPQGPSQTSGFSWRVSTFNHLRALHTNKWLSECGRIC